MNADPKKAEQGDDVDGIEGEHDVPELMEVDAEGSASEAFHDFPLGVLKLDVVAKSQELFDATGSADEVVDVRVRSLERRNVVEGFPGSERSERDAVKEGLSDQGLEGLSACHGISP